MTRNMRTNDAATARNLAKNTTLGTMNTAADARMGTAAGMGAAAITDAPARTLRSKGFGLAALLLAAAFAMPAAADDRWSGRDRADADIESLDAVLRLSAGGAELFVRYDIEIEHAWYGEEFDLLLEIEQIDGLVRDETGRPVLMAVPLGEPSDVDGDELEFENAVTLSVPAPRDLAKLRNTRIIATVVRAGSDLPLDSERESLRVEFCGNVGGTWGEWRPAPAIGVVREVTATTAVRRTTAVRHTEVRRVTEVRPTVEIRVIGGVTRTRETPRPHAVNRPHTANRPHEPRRETTTLGGRTTGAPRPRENGRDVRRTGEPTRTRDARTVERNPRDTRRTNDGNNVRRTSNGRETNRTAGAGRATDTRDTRRETTTTRRTAENTRNTQNTRTVRR